MNGLLVIDKPAGPTSHDVVARMRRVLHERAIGHTGTLDPMATGVLPLVIGRATRLSRFLTAGDKSYRAVVRLGYATDTGDADGCPVGPRYEGVLPSRDAIDRALDAFRGTFDQQPPAFSAKKLVGRRSYVLARGARRSRQTADPPLPPAAVPARVRVTAHGIHVVSVEGDTVTLRVDCSAGFYVRALAHDLGEALGTGAHLAALRRTRSGTFTLDDAIELGEAEQHPDRAAAAVMPLSRLLADWPTVVLSPEGVRHAAHGRDLGPADAARTEAGWRAGATGFVRLLDAGGDLVGVAEPARTPGLLHPCIVLM